MNRDNLKIEFGHPEHGWLPVYIRQGEFSLEFIASDVPLNPIEQLISLLRLLQRGISGEIWWHLEPAGYYFSFDKQDKLYQFSISFAENESATKDLIFETEGSFGNIILPFYRALKKFFTQSFDELHWPRTEQVEIEKIINFVM